MPHFGRKSLSRVGEPTPSSRWLKQALLPQPSTAPLTLTAYCSPQAK